MSELRIKQRLLCELSARRHNMSSLCQHAGISPSTLSEALSGARLIAMKTALVISLAATELTGHYYHYSDFMPADDGGWETDYYQHESRALRKIFDCWLDGHVPNLDEYTAEETQNIYALFERVKDLHREAQNLEVHTTLKRREI